MTEIQVGKGKEIDSIFEGTINKKEMKRKDGIRLMATVYKEINKDPLDGVLFMLETLESVYKVKLEHDGVKYKDIESLYETAEGEEMIKDFLVPRLSGAITLSKN